MKYPVYSIRDSLTGFMTPTLDQNDASAMRNFRVACEQSGSSLMFNRPADFSLYRIGIFDTDTGSLTPVIPPEVICLGEK